jgi:AcrR family transcriptional regulator
MPEGLRELRRSQIVAEARRIVADKGLEALTIGALEARLSFTRGVITYHFKGKDDIVEAVLDSAVDEIDRAMFAEMHAGRTLEDRIRAVLRGQIHGWIERAEAARVVLSFWGRLQSDPRMSRVNARVFARYRAYSAELLGEAADPQAGAALLVGTVIGIACQHHFDPGSIDVDAAIETAVPLFLALGSARDRTARGKVQRPR